MVMSGYTGGRWADTQNGGRDFVAMSMDTDGNVLWEYQVRRKADRGKGSLVKDSKTMCCRGVNFDITDGHINFRECELQFYRI